MSKILMQMYSDLGMGVSRKKCSRSMELKRAPFLREYTVEEELEKLQQRCLSAHIARVADVVATNGDPCAVRVVLVWTDFTYNHGMAYFLSLEQRDILVIDAKESVGTGYTLGAGGLS
jgi:hypothetical protein